MTKSETFPKLRGGRQGLKYDDKHGNWPALPSRGSAAERRAGGKVGMVFLALLVAVRGNAQTNVDPARIERLLRRAIVVDLHTDTTGNIVRARGFDLGELHNYGQVDIPRMRKGHVTAVFMATNPDSARFKPIETMRQAFEDLDAVRREVRRHPADLVLASSPKEILEAKKHGKMAVVQALEGGYIIDTSLPVLRSLYELGARYMTLVHFVTTAWADSSTSPAQNNGLAPFGREVVLEMNRLGMMVDVAHAADKTFWNVLETSRAPIINSHTSCRVFSNHPRSMSDEMMRALAKKGGVIHICFYNPYLDEAFRRNRPPTEDLDAREKQINAEFANDPERRLSELRKVWAARIARGGRVPFSRVLDHFEHAVKVAGVNHVGLGSDFDGVQDDLPEGMEDISKIPNLVRGLMERGFSDGDIEKILGGNSLRVMSEIQSAGRP